MGSSHTKTQKVTSVETKGNISLIQNGIRQDKLGLFNEAEVSFTKALKKNPTNHAVLGRLAIVYYKQRKFDEAISTAQRAIELYPNFPLDNEILEMALDGKGEALELNNQLSEAEECYKTAIQQNPQTSHTLYRLALLKRNQGLNEEAIPLLLKVIEIDPDTAEPYVDLAIILLKQEKLQEALSYCKEAVR
ncbi:hypothetical protein CHUAL_005949 [Chamberlinius hualienensis]